jgi:uncharacterized NAD(P)/FAD-binding protein YdhS
VATLDSLGHRSKILAVSRRGLVSRQRRVTQNAPFGDFKTRPQHTAVGLLRQVRATIRDSAASFSCWEAVIESIRCQGTEIWAALPDAERGRFLRHLRPFWDVHRYQLAPQLGDIMERKIDKGQLAIEAARITQLRQEAGTFHVTLSHGTENRTEIFDAIINCTGPDHAHIIETSQVLASLARAGYIHADPYRLGIDTDLQARPLNAHNQPTATLFIAGPLARASFGELMGLPQVTSHAALVAQCVGDVSGTVLGISK